MANFENFTCACAHCLELKFSPYSKIRLVLAVIREFCKWSPHFHLAKIAHFEHPLEKYPFLSYCFIVYATNYFHQRKPEVKSKTCFFFFDIKYKCVKNWFLDLQYVPCKSKIEVHFQNYCSCRSYSLNFGKTVERIEALKKWLINREATFSLFDWREKWFLSNLLNLDFDQNSLCYSCDRRCSGCRGEHLCGRLVCGNAHVFRLLTQETTQLRTDSALLWSS